VQYALLYAHKDVIIYCANNIYFEKYSRVYFMEFSLRGEIIAAWLLQKRANYITIILRITMIMTYYYYNILIHRRDK